MKRYATWTNTWPRNPTIKKAGMRAPMLTGRRGTFRLRSKIIPRRWSWMQTTELVQKNFLPIFQKYQHPKTAQDFYTRGKALYDAAYYQNAEFDLQRSIELDDFNPDAYYWLGKALEANGCYDAAIEQFKK